MTILRYQLQQGSFVAYPDDADTMDLRYSPEPDVVAGLGGLAREPEDHFYVEAENSDLDVWRHGIRSEAPEQSDVIDQGTWSDSLRFGQIIPLGIARCTLHVAFAMPSRSEAPLHQDKILERLLRTPGARGLKHSLSLLLGAVSATSFSSPR